MTRRTSSTPFAAFAPFAAAALTALGCAGCGESVPARYRGAPLGTLKGTLDMASSPTFDETKPIRLAIVWLNFSGTPKAVVPQAIDYRGTFPVRYAFDLFDAPPAAALFDFGPAKGALGVVAAYQDGNGNGTLDTIPHSGARTDLVLGYARMTLQYFDAATSTAGIVNGYHLLGAGDAGEVPLDTPIPLQLGSDPRNALLICEDIGLAAIPPGGPCGIPFPGLSGAVGEVDGAPYAALAVTLNGAPVTDGSAVVKVGGHLVPADGAGGYRLPAGAAFTLQGEVVVEVSVGGGANGTTLRIPGPFHLDPLAGPVAVGAPLHLSWSAAADATCYEASLLDAGGHAVATWSVPGATATDLQTASLAPGAYTARVNAGCTHWSGLVAVDPVQAVTAPVQLQ